MLPARNLVVLRDGAAPKSSVPAWVQDYALFLLDADGRIVAWYAGAERIYGYKSEEVIGQHVSIFYPDEEAHRQAAGRIEAGRRAKAMSARKAGT